MTKNPLAIFCSIFSNSAIDYKQIQNISFEIKVPYGQKDLYIENRTCINGSADTIRVY